MLALSNNIIFLFSCQKRGRRTKESRDNGRLDCEPCEKLLKLKKRVSQMSSKRSRERKAEREREGGREGGREGEILAALNEDCRTINDNLIGKFPGEATT